ncbi:hypothetical protein Y032_0434g1397 [Ancylostoma ceylanicum]|uniref:Uncharacterized protein n=1 Tax=Ancylostoma ceylanicum TaxID=53326 RepID=A0A016X001_9BILA|nr:hypothetical protein Y032_0434g1397 [Ancylostoma ceylanicum]
MTNEFFIARHCTRTTGFRTQLDETEQWLTGCKELEEMSKWRARHVLACFQEKFSPKLRLMGFFKVLNTNIVSIL